MGKCERVVIWVCDPDETVVIHVSDPGMCDPNMWDVIQVCGL